MNPNLNSQQFIPAAELRSKFRPEPHELYSENTGEPWFDKDDEVNLQKTRQFKLDSARQHDDRYGGSLVDHIKTSGFPDTVLLDPDWETIVDGNHRLEAAHSISPDFPVPVTFKESRRKYT